MTKNLGNLITALALIGAVTACGSEDSTAQQKKSVSRVVVEESAFKATELENTVDSLVSAITDAAPKTPHLNINLKELSGYWEPVVVGANRALGELAVPGEVEAPDFQSLGEGHTPDQVTVLQENQLVAARAAGAVGFGIAPNTNVLIPEIGTEVDAGFPVVLIDSDLPDSKRDFYIGTMNAAAGQTAGNSLKALLPAAPGTVIILGHDDPGWPDGYDRTMGTKAVLEGAGYVTAITTVDWNEGGEAKNVQAMVDAINAANPPVVGMIGMFSNAYRCAMAAEATGKTGSDIAIAAFDFDAKTVAYMQSGLIKVTHAQRQYYMGYLTPYILYGVNVLGKDKTKALLATVMVDDHRINSGLDVVPADKLDQYYTFLEKLGISGN